MKASEIMTKDVISVKSDSTIEDIAAVLTENKISGVPVVDDGGTVLGIVSEKDLLYKDVEPHFPPFIELLGGKIFLSGVKEYNEELKKLVATTAEQIMTRDVITVQLDTEVNEIADLMVENDVNRVPVTDNDVLVGIVSRADIVRYIAKNR